MGGWGTGKREEIARPTFVHSPFQMHQVDADTRGYRLATAVSYVVNPLILPPIGFGLVLWHFGAGAPEIRNGVGAGLVFFFLLPLLYVALMVRRGEAATLEVRSQQARTRPFLVGIVSYVIGVAFLWMILQTARPLMLALAAIYPINTALVALINLRLKISVHVASIAGFFAGLFFVAQMSWNVPTIDVLTTATVASWALLIPVVMWARVRSGAHTPGQVVGGAIFGFGMTLAQLFVAVSAFSSM